MKNKLPKTNQYSPEEVSKATYLHNSYVDLARAIKEGTPIKDVKYVREDMQLHFILMEKEDKLSKYMELVDLKLETLQIQNKIQVLRNMLSNKDIRIEQINNEINKEKEK